MFRHACFGLLLGLLPLGAAAALAAEGLIVRHGDRIEPDEELLAFVNTLREKLASGKKSEYRAIERMFAPKVLTFQRGLDPMQPWNASETISGNYLRNAVDVLVEQGELQDGVAPPDYRPQLLGQMLSLIPENVVFGRIPQVKKAICAPAAYQIDRDAAQAFAAVNEDGIGSLRFYPAPIEMRRRPIDEAAGAGVLPAYTLASFVYDPTAPSDWALLVASNGIRGYVPDSGQLTLSQQHICFGKVKGRYRITALFGYGL